MAWRRVSEAARVWTVCIEEVMRWRLTGVVVIGRSLLIHLDAALMELLVGLG